MISVGDVVSFLATSYSHHGPHFFRWSSRRWFGKRSDSSTSWPEGCHRRWRRSEGRSPARAGLRGGSVADAAIRPRIATAAQARDGWTMWGSFDSSACRDNQENAGRHGHPAAPALNND